MKLPLLFLGTLGGLLAAEIDPKRPRGESVGEPPSAGAKAAPELSRVFPSAALAKEPVLMVENATFRLSAWKDDERIWFRLFDQTTQLTWADGEYMYALSADTGSRNEYARRRVAMERSADGLAITVETGGIVLRHNFSLPPNRPIMEETMTVTNVSGGRLALGDIETGFTRFVSEQPPRIIGGLERDVFTAIPFRRRPDDPPGTVNEFSITDLMVKSGFKPSIDSRWNYRRLPADRHYSEGWAWTHGGKTLGVFSFNEENMSFSTLAMRRGQQGQLLRFGGFSMVAGEPADLTRIEPGKSVDLGLVRYQAFDGDYTEALYGFRELLDERGCRFPEGYNPPVHWNELYDVPEYGGVTSPGSPALPRPSVRKHSYSKELLEKEAAKAREYSCEALYLDPGWDTQFGSFIWGEEWLGPRREFIRDIRDKYGLKVALHCPMATWMTKTGSRWWPPASFKTDQSGAIVPRFVCQGSSQYMDVALERLLASCADGVAFLMFDGTLWNDGCWNQLHGHPVPYLKEDHVRALTELAQRIHARYPEVLIEMHDMIAAGTTHRMTPVYYKYSLPGSYDENWAFEFMWKPLNDLKFGGARSLYYYNMGVNVPLYLHIDLRNDDQNALAFWWYASTCRHLGIGGTHSNPSVAAMQREAMKKYRELDRFFKQGEFYGLGEEIHLHVLPRENAFVVNVFNLSDEQRTISGSIRAERLGVDLDRWYLREGPRSGRFVKGAFEVKADLPPWSTQLMVFRSAPAG